jgi:hypothetical protein
MFIFYYNPRARQDIGFYTNTHLRVIEKNFEGILGKALLPPTPSYVAVSRVAVPNG